MQFAEYDSPIGKLLLQSDGEHLMGLWFGKVSAPVQAEGAVIEKAKRWLDGYFRGETAASDIPLLPQGTAFQKQVWQILLSIPYGQTRTYGDIAREMAIRTGKRKMSAQAVGQAVGRNPVSIIIPCHRVIGAGGRLTGYAGGLEAKQWLLHHEGVIL